MPVGHKIEYLVGVTAGESLTAAQYHMVKRSSATEVMLCDAGGDDVDVVGVLLNAPASGEVAEVATWGSLGVLVKVLAADTNIGIGDFLKADTGNTGKAIKTVTDKDTYGARANAASTADNDLIRVDLVVGLISAA